MLTAIQMLHVHTDIGPTLTFTMEEAAVSHFGGKSRGNNIWDIVFQWQPSGMSFYLRCLDLLDLGKKLKLFQREFEL